MAGKLVGAGMLAAGALLLAPVSPVSAVSSAAPPAQLTPGGLAEIHGKMPKHKSFKPALYVLSHDKRFSADDAVLGTKRDSAPKKHYRAWVALPDVIQTGGYRLLGCKHAKPSRGSCVAVKKVTVRPSAPIPVATPTLDTARAKSGTIDLQGGSVSVTAADGTTFTLTVPDHSVPNLDATLTPVSSLTPAGAVGKLVAGVMIEPLGSAPAGSTLEIKRASVPQGARAVAFGGVDPSGGAFPLPAKVTADTQIPLTALGGYGIVVGGSSRTHGAKTVPCQTASPAGADTGGAQPLMNCIALAQRMRALADARIQSGADTYDMFAALSQEVAGEVSRVTALPPTDEGDAELSLMMELAIGVVRQAALLHLPESATEPLVSAAQKALEYHLNKLKSVCMGSPQHSSELYLEYFYEAFFDARQDTLMGGSMGDIDAILTACLKKVKLQLTGNDDATVDNGQWTQHVVAKAVATITGNDEPILVSNDPDLSFKTSKSTADKQLIDEGGTPETTSSNGKMFGNLFGFDVMKRIRCDAHKKLHVERKAYLYVTLRGLWDDTENVTITFNGNPVSGFHADAASDSWVNDYFSQLQKVKLEINGDEVTRTNSGKCSQGIECMTFSYDASLQVVALQN